MSNTITAPAKIAHVIGSYSIDADHRLATEIRHASNRYHQKASYYHDGGTPEELERAAEASRLHATALELVEAYKETGAPFKPYGKPWESRAEAIIEANDDAEMGSWGHSDPTM